MNAHWVLIGAALALFWLYVMPAPEGCGCAERKRKLQRLGGEVFGG